jgi:hypothetical protein
MSVTLEPFSLAKVASAVEKVHQRLLRATAALERAGVAYAVAGGNAVAAWVRRADENAVRNTRDVDILLRRADLAAAREALAREGFIYRHVGGMDVFLDGEHAGIRGAVHVIFAGEKVRAHEALPNPDVTQTEQADEYVILSLEALVQIKLTAFRDKDRTHLRDMLDVGLIDQSWTARYPPALAERLQLLIDTPEG